MHISSFKIVIIMWTSHQGMKLC